MTDKELVLEYVKVLVWPVTAAALLIYFRDVIRSFLERGGIELTILGVTIKTNAETLTRALQANLPTERLSDEQAKWLEQAEKGPTPYDNVTDRAALRPLRNTGLIRERTGRTLSSGRAIEITPLGKLLWESRAKSVK